MWNWSAILLQTQKGKLTEENNLWAFAQKESTVSPMVLEALVRGCLRTYRLNSALKYLDFWLKEQPDQPRVLLWKAETLVLLKRPTDAIDTLTKLVETKQDKEEAQLALGKVLADSSRPGEALEQFDHILGGAPLFTAAASRAGAGGMSPGLEPRPARPARPSTRCQPSSSNCLGLSSCAARSNWPAINRPPPSPCCGKRSRPHLRTARRFTPSPCAWRNYNNGSRRIKLREKVKRMDRDREQLDALTQKIIAMPTNAGLRCQAGELCLKGWQPTRKESAGWESALLEDPLNRQAHSLLAAYYNAHDQPELAARAWAESGSC